MDEDAYRACWDDEAIKNVGDYFSTKQHLTEIVERFRETYALTQSEDGVWRIRANWDESSALGGYR